MKMELSEINTFKERLLKNKQPNEQSKFQNNEQQKLVTYVTNSVKITQYKQPNKVADEGNEEISFTLPKLIPNYISPLLSLVEEYVSNSKILTCRPLTDGKIEQLDVTRIKPDHMGDDGIPITAARLIFRNDGLVKFSLITGKVDEKQLNIDKNLSSEVEMLLGKLSDTHRFCLGLPASTLPEIRCYPHSFQFYQDAPYKHARSKDCLQWYQQSNQTTVRERLGVVKARCPPCKMYFCRIAKWCRENVKKQNCVKTNKQSNKKSEKKQLVNKEVQNVGDEDELENCDLSNESVSPKILKPRKRGYPQKVAKDSFTDNIETSSYTKKQTFSQNLQCKKRGRPPKKAKISSTDNSEKETVSYRIRQPRKQGCPQKMSMEENIDIENSDTKEASQNNENSNVQELSSQCNNRGCCKRVNSAKFQFERSKRNHASTLKTPSQLRRNKLVDQASQTDTLTLDIFENIVYDCNYQGFTGIDQKAEAVLLASVCTTQALYDASDDVVELTAGNFNGKVVNGDEVWMVEFYAPWCGHCRSLAPEWKKAASALKGIVKVGAVDMDVHGSVGGPYNIRGFPTIKIFGGNKKSPQDFNGARSAQAIVDEAMKTAQRLAKDRLTGGGSSRGGSDGGSGGSSDDVVELTDANFEKEVFGTKDPVLVEFFAPWCGHCQRLAPEWKKAASELKGKVKIAALDATAHTAMASKFQVQGYPTIKVFRAGLKDFSSAEDYQGGRTATDIIAYALDLHAAAVEPPEIMELVSNSVLAENCNEKPLCIISFLPDILDTQAKGRNRYLNILKELGEKYKAKLWGWVWTSAAFHGKLEQALGIGGFGYPALAVVNIRKKVFVGLRGAFSYQGIDELLKSIAVGRGRTEKLPSLPTISDIPAWDGKDGKLPEEEDIDLSDIELDDLDSDKKEEL